MRLELQTKGVWGGRDKSSTRVMKGGSLGKGTSEVEPAILRVPALPGYMNSFVVVKRVVVLAR